MQALAELGCSKRTQRALAPKRTSRASPHSSQVARRRAGSLAGARSATTSADPAQYHQCAIQPLLVPLLSCSCWSCWRRWALLLPARPHTLSATFYTCASALFPRDHVLSKRRERRCSAMPPLPCLGNLTPFAVSHNQFTTFPLQ